MVIAPAAVFVLPFDKIRWLYVIALIFCATVPLKFTVLDVFEVTFRLPAVIVKVLAIPNTELADKVSDVPLMVTLYRLAMPFKFDVPVKVAVPAVAVKLPLTSNELAMEKDAVADNVPVAANA